MFSDQHPATSRGWRFRVVGYFKLAESLFIGMGQLEVILKLPKYLRYFVEPAILVVRVFAFRVVQSMHLRRPWVR